MSEPSVRADPLPWPRSGPTEPEGERAPAPAPVLTASDQVRTPGQRLYDMPYSAVAPRLVNPVLGLNLVARAGHNAAYQIDVTLLDAPDHRLIRAGVLLAHRVLDGRGEWYLTAPDWEPLLPRDRIEPMGHADLPEDLADLIRPLRRRAALGPVAALRCDRREFALRDDAGTTRALLRDDRVTVRRGGLTTARYRELMLTPVGPGLHEEQTAWLDRALVGVGSTAVPRFHRLVTRLGAPATSPGDVPGPAPFDPDAPFRRFVGQLVGLRLRHVVEADLAVRGGDLAATDRLVAEAAGLATELAGLRPVVEADWLADLLDELAWLPAEPTVQSREQLAARIRGERYLALLDLLVLASRPPRFGAVGEERAGDVVDGLLRSAVERVQTAVDAAAPTEDAGAWAEVAGAVSGTDAAVAVAAHVSPERAAEVTHRLAKPRRLLGAAATGQQDEVPVAGLTPEQAFAAGRSYERGLLDARQGQAAFLRAWAKAHLKLLR